MTVAGASQHFAHARAQGRARADRDRDPERGERAARLPARRRARVPDARSRGGDAVGRRGAAHPAGVPARLRAVGRDVRARRAVDRPAPARQPAAHRARCGGCATSATACIVVEHDAETIESADHVVDFGPGAGRLGGRVVAAGTPDDLKAEPRVADREVPGRRGAHRGAGARAARRKGFIDRQGRARAQPEEHRRRVPARRAGRGDRRVGRGQVVAHQRHPAARRCGASCSAATTRSARHGAVVGIEADRQGDRHRPEADRPHAALEPGDVHQGVRRDPRRLRADARGARLRLPARALLVQRASGGRCEACEGDGVRQVEMHFLPDVYVTCEVCRGKRYNEATLRVKWKDRTSPRCSRRPCRRRCGLFEHHRDAARDPDDAGRRRPRLHRARPVGDDAVGRRGPAHQAVARAGEARHGQDALPARRADDGPALRGRAQAAARCSTAWSTAGNTVLVIEHNLDVIKAADYVIDLGPEGGARGGEVVAAGTPEEVARVSALVHRPVPRPPPRPPPPHQRGVAAQAPPDLSPSPRRYG